MDGEKSAARWLPAALAAAICAAFANSLPVPFLFDDATWVVRNPDIRTLAHPGRLLLGTSRPLLKLSLALNYAVGGLDPRGYHAVNVVIHVLAALTLYGVVRHTLHAPALRGRGAAHARPLAFALALLWALHPLQTQAVTYVVQRGEALMGLFYLTTLYAAIRCAEGGRRRVAWGSAAVAACALGMGAKEVMVTAPLIVLLYDRTFFAGSFRAALRARRGLYLGLAASWGVMFGAIGPSVLFHGEFARSTRTPPAPLDYALTQPGVILHYLRLALWPHPLCFDYGWPVAARPWGVVGPLLGVALLLLACAVALVRGSWLGFAGAWFFLILAPTSSVLPIADIAVEHRMYLPLAAVVALAVAALARLAARAGRRGTALATALLAAAAVALGAATFQRNRDYYSEVSLWRTAVRAAPWNARAYYNLGTALRAAGRSEDAIPPLVRALALDPEHVEAHYNLANALKAVGRNDEAIRHYRRALALEPGLLHARVNLGNALQAEGRFEEALAEYRGALQLAPDDPRVLYDLGIVLERLGRDDEALATYRRARALAPSFVSVHVNLGRLRARRGDLDAAEASFRDALRLDPRHPRARAGLGSVLLAQGRFDDAAAEFRRALEIAPDSRRAREGRARALAREAP